MSFLFLYFFSVRILLSLWMQRLLAMLPQFVQSLEMTWFFSFFGKMLKIGIILSLVFSIFPEKNMIEQIR